VEATTGREVEPGACEEAGPLHPGQGAAIGIPHEPDIPHAMAPDHTR